MWHRAEQSRSFCIRPGANEKTSTTARPVSDEMNKTARMFAACRLSVEQVFATPILVTSWRESLNPAQLAAVTCGPGPVLVIAGAGTGKTWTLACRVAHLIERGVPPERILLLTFSRRAAREMLSRADRLVLGNRTGKVWGGTFHSIAHRL